MRRFCLGRSDEQNEIRGEMPVCVGIDANRLFASTVLLLTFVLSKSPALKHQILG